MKKSCILICVVSFLVSGMFLPLQAKDSVLFKMWQNAFKTFELAEEQELDGKKADSYKTFEKALSSFSAIKKKAPKWNKQIISSRIRLCKLKMKSLKRRIKAASNVDDGFVPIRKSSIGPATSLRTEVQPRRQVPVVPQRPSIASSLSDSVAAMESKLNEYKTLYSSALLEVERLKKEQAAARHMALQVQALLKEKRELVQKYTLLSARLNDLQGRKTKETELLEKWKTHFESERLNNKTLKEELAALMKSNAELMQKEQNATAAQALFSKQIASKEEVAKKLAVQIKEISAKLNAQNQMLSVLKKGAVDFQKEKQSLLASVKKKTDELSALNVKFQKISAGGGPEVAKKLQAENQGLKQRNDSLNQQVVKLTQANKELKANFDSIASKNKKNDTIAANLSSQYSVLQKDFIAFRKKYENEKAVSAQKQVKINELTTANKALSDEIKKYAETLEGLYKKIAKAAELEKKNLALTGQVSQYKQSLASRDAGYKKTLTGLQETNKKLVADKKSLSDRMQQLQKQVAANSSQPELEKARQQLTTENQSLKQQVDGLARGKQQMSAEIAKLKQQLAQKVAGAGGDPEKSAEFIKLKKLLQLTLQERNKLVSDRNNLKAQVVAVSAEKAELKKAADANSAKMQKYTAELTQLNKQAEDNKIKNQQYSKEVNNLKNFFEQYKKELLASKKEVAELRVKHRTAVDKAAKEKQVLEKTLKQHGGRLQKARSEVQNMQQSNIGLNKKIRLLTSDCDNLKKKLENDKNAYSREKAIIVSQHSKEKQQLSASNKEMAKALEELKSQKTQQSRQLDQYKASLGKHDTAVKNKDSELVNLKKRFQALTVTLNEQKSATEKSKEYLKKMVQLNKTLNNSVAVKERELTKLKDQLSANTQKGTPDRKVVKMLLETAVESEKKNDFEAAIWHHRKIIDIDRKNLVSLKKLGKLYGRQRDLKNAIVYYEKAYTVNQDDVDVLLALGILYKEAKKCRMALAVLNKAHALAPDNFMVAKAVGDVCSQLGWYGAAEKEYRSALRINPKSANANQALAVLLSKHFPNKRDEAKQYYQAAKQLGVKLEEQAGGN